MRKIGVIANIKVRLEIIISVFTDTKMRKIGGVWSEHSWEKSRWTLYTCLEYQRQGNGISFYRYTSDYDSKNTLVVAKFVYLNPARAFLKPMTLTVRAKENGNSSESYLCQDGC